eukprot:TRINITY_DN76150_c0_g1_i1.p1 TRINITY_DN76150_c0_g1~~TRINITY_DN76150_c0_g1_i1.p1  ORF type:complete len:867 (+),score=198.65 TRINITY_DN76150_c0_g1_i1:304-2601(+)
MLCGSFVEGTSREVRLLDVEPSAFEVMLKLIYTGTAEITADNVLAILDVGVRFDVAPLVQFSVQFLQNHTTSEHACRMLEVGVQYGLVKLVDKCIELIVTDDHIMGSEDFNRLSQAAVIELAKHDSWNLHEDEIYDTLVRWAAANASEEVERRSLAEPILEHLRYPHMSVEKLKLLSTSNDVPSQLIFEALFYKLKPSSFEEAEIAASPADSAGGGNTDAASQAGAQPQRQQVQMSVRYRPRPGSLLFSWVPTSRVTVSGDYRENARHTSSNGFTGVRGDRRMLHGTFSWTVDISETQSSWIFVGVAQADDTNDVAWRSTGHMLYCLDSRFFHQGSGQNHPAGDRKIMSGDCIRVVLDCTRHTLAFGVNNEKPTILFRDLEPTFYVPAVDLRDCGDKVRILSCQTQQRPSQGGASSPSRGSGQQPAQPQPQGQPMLALPQPQPPQPRQQQHWQVHWQAQEVPPQQSLQQQLGSRGRPEAAEDMQDILAGLPPPDRPSASGQDMAAAASAAASVVSAVTMAAVASATAAAEAMDHEASPSMPPPLAPGSPDLDTFPPAMEVPGGYEVSGSAAAVRGSVDARESPHHILRQHQQLNAMGLGRHSLPASELQVQAVHPSVALAAGPMGHCSTSRTLQPRQSQGPQGSLPSASPPTAVAGSGQQASSGGAVSSSSAGRYGNRNSSMDGSSSARSDSGRSRGDKQAAPAATFRGIPAAPATQGQGCSATQRQLFLAQSSRALESQLAGPASLGEGAADVHERVPPPCEDE